MNSMTGFGRGSASRDGWDVVVLVNSVNRKSLEVAFSMPRDWQGLEPDLAAVVRERVARGRIHVSIDVRGMAQAGMAWNDDVVGAVLDRLGQLAAARGLAFDPTPELLFQIAAASGSEGARLDAEQALALVRPALEQAVGGMVAMRRREGEVLAADIAARVEELRRLVEIIAGRAAGTVSAYQEALTQRLRSLGLEIDLSDERVLKEIALFADRIDISEEITRLRSHLEHMAAVIGVDEPVGRKAEFILQEVGREFHTVGSKANDLEIARVVIDAKNELERIREQVQNVE